MLGFIVLLLGTITMQSTESPSGHAAWYPPAPAATARQLTFAMVNRHQTQVHSTRTGNVTFARRGQTTFDPVVRRAYCVDHQFMLSAFEIPDDAPNIGTLLTGLHTLRPAANGWGILPAIGPALGNDLSTFLPTGCTIAPPVVWIATARH